MTQQTLPMVPRALSATAGGLDEFRVSAPRDIAAMLGRLCDAGVPLRLDAGDGSALVQTMMWAADAARGSVGFNVEADDPGVQRLLELQRAVAVGHLDAVKLQFDVVCPVLVRGTGSSVLRCQYPHELFRFQRRGAYRVRPLPRSTPMAQLQHPMRRELTLALRVLDVSIGGCALFMPGDLPVIHPGTLLPQAQIELDADTRFHVDLRLQHITSLDPDTGGVRLGCEFEGAGGDALRALQRFIERTQKRGRLIGTG